MGDGSANNWKLQRRFFGSFVPILDFIHALSYVFAAALAGRRFAAGWAAEFTEAGHVGHLDLASGHGPWPEGLLRFGQFLRGLG